MIGTMVVGPLAIEEIAPGQFMFTVNTFPEEIEVCQEVLDDPKPDCIDMAGDELCFQALNGRCLYRRADQYHDRMSFRYVLVGSVGPT